MWGVGLSNIPAGTLGYKGPQAHMRTLVVAMQPGKLRLPGTRAALRIHFFGFVLAPSVGPGLVSKGPGNPGIVHLLAQLELFGNCATFQKKPESGGLRRSLRGVPGICFSHTMTCVHGPSVTVSC